MPALKSRHFNAENRQAKSIEQARNAGQPENGKQRQRRNPGHSQIIGIDIGIEQRENQEDVEAQKQAVEKIRAFCINELGLEFRGVLPAAIKGPKGNQEYMALFRAIE